jgi:hypothetical protein
MIARVVVQSSPLRTRRGAPAGLRKRRSALAMREAGVPHLFPKYCRRDARGWLGQLLQDVLDVGGDCRL